MILVILVIIEIIVNKVIMALMLKVVIKDRCVLKMWFHIYIPSPLRYRAPSELKISFIEFPNRCGCVGGVT